MIEVLAILPNDMAIVSTKGLHRVTETKSGKVVEELLDGEGVVGRVTCLVQQPCRETVTSYEDLHRQAKFDAEYSGHAPVKRPRPEILAILPGCIVVSSHGLRRVQVEPCEGGFTRTSGEEVIVRGDGPTQILAELVTKAEAKRVAGKFANRIDAREASIIRYDDVAPCGLAVDVARGRVIDGSGDVGSDGDDAAKQAATSTKGEQQRTAAD